MLYKEEMGMMTGKNTMQGRRAGGNEAKRRKRKSLGIMHKIKNNVRL